MDSFMDSSTSEEEIDAREIEYDHFDTEHKVLVQPLPEEIQHSLFMSQQVKRETGGSYGRTKMAKMLRRKLLEHKWEDAALIFEQLSTLPVQTNSQMNDMFWKVGNEILYNHPAAKYEPDLVSQHRQASKTQCFNTDGAHILYEYALYLMARRDFQAAREVLNFYYIQLKAYHPVKKSYSVLSKWLKDWSPVFEGYLGVLDYISWKEMESQLGSAFPSSSENEIAESTRAEIAEQGIKHFEKTFASPGVWDIFVGKYIELLEYLGQIVEAEEVLRTNSLKYPNNPNAHKYWYRFLLKHPELEENRDSRIQALSKLKEAAPSDILMLDLHDLRMETAFKYEPKSPQFLSMVTMSLEILMDMLDYHCWLKHEKSWHILAASLKKVKSAIGKRGFSEILETIWIAPTRHTWWHRYHFTPTKAKEYLELSRELAKSKASVAKILIGSKCDFCKYIKAARESSR